MSFETVDDVNRFVETAFRSVPVSLLVPSISNQSDQAHYTGQLLLRYLLWPTRTRARKRLPRRLHIRRINRTHKLLKGRYGLGTGLHSDPQTIPGPSNIMSLRRS